MCYLLFSGCQCLQIVLGSNHANVAQKIDEAEKKRPGGGLLVFGHRSGDRENTHECGFGLTVTERCS